MHRAQGAGGALALLVAPEFLQRGQQRPGLIAGFRVGLEAKVPDAASVGGLELDERRRDVAVGRRGFAGAEAGRIGLGQAGAEHVGNGVAAL